jgi:predicted Zn-dependent protease
VLLLLPACLLAQSGDLAAKSARVKDLMAEGRFADAVPLCEELVRALPSNSGLRLNLALALHMSGRHREAIPEFERVLKTEPNSVPALLSLGAARLETNDPDRAIAPLTKVVELDPKNHNARGMLASALMAVDRPHDAAEQFRKLTVLTPTDPKAWHGLGRAYEALSAAAFDELNKTAEGSSEWLALIAETRMTRHQYRSAFYFYQQALAKTPDFQPALAGMAAVYRATGHPDWAAVIERKTHAPDCAKDKPACDYAAGRFREAAASASPYWRARAYNELARRAFAQLAGLPESIELHAIKAQVAASQDQPLEAANEWRAALKLAPGDPDLKRQLAAALYEAGDYKSALPIFEELRRRAPDAPRLQFLIGDSYLRLEQPDKALPFLEPAARSAPDFPPAQASLGLAYIRTGKPAEAIPHLEKALSTDEDGSLHYQLARAYQAAGNTEKARAMMAQYQQIQSKLQSEKRNLEQTVKITAPGP